MKVDRQKYPLHRPCVEFDGCRIKHGYGTKWFEGKMWLAHRLVYFLLTGDLPEVVMHRCDNPPCIEPSHLRGGTHADNMDDMVAKGRAARQKGEKHYNSKITEQDVRDIRADPAPQTQIAKRYGIARSVVSDIKNRKIWRHVV